MSPEQARGEPHRLRAATSSPSGVMLFELTTGKRLFKGASEFETLKLICEREYPLPSQARLGYPRELEAIVMRALAKDRAQRYQSAREMQAALEEFVRRERIPVSTIALTQFMQALFEEKLASQKEALLQGKQLADIIALESGADSSTGVDTRPAVSSTGAATRTLAGERAQRGRTAWTGAIAAFALLAGAGATLWWTRRPADTPAPSSATTVSATDTAAPTVSMLSPPSTPSTAAADPHPSAALDETPPPVSADSPPASPAPERRPVATRPVERPAPATPPAVAGTGKLNVAARGGWCNVAVDGAGRGPTPVAGIVLPAGPHTVTCTPEGGHPMAATVKVESDATARYSFTLPQ